MGVVSACLPTLRPLALLILRYISRVTNYRMNLGSKDYARRSKGYADMGHSRTWPGKRNPPMGGLTTISASQGEEDVEHVAIGLDQIKVQRDLHLTHEVV